MGKSRTANTFYNFFSSVLGQFISIFLQFIVRTVFINTLGKSYLGINGLFSNILSMLSLAELGVGSAILFKFYDPLSRDDKKRINVLIKFYKKVYTIIGIVVLIIGLCFIPFLRYMVKDYNKLESLGINATFIYILYLMQSVSSYLFFAYKSAVVKADQKEYILNFVNYAINILTSLVQIMMLVIFKNFETYVIILVLSIIIQNYVNAKIAEKKYPYIKNKEENQISKEEIKEIFKDCAAIFLYRLNAVVLNATDNVIISIFLGLEMVGMYSNYYVLYTTINTIFMKVFDSVTHSLGNLHTTKDYKHEYKIFKTVNLIAITLGATAGIGVFCLADEFVELWIGKNWLIAQPFALLMGIEVYTLASRVYLSKYRNSMGLFQQAKYRPLFGMIINLVLSTILVKYWGICGVLVGTIVADWTTLMWFDPLIIHKYGLKEKFSVGKFYMKNLVYVVVTVIIGAINYLVSTKICVNQGWISFALHAGICVVTVPIAFFLISYKQEEGKELWNLGSKIGRKIIKK